MAAKNKATLLSDLDAQLPVKGSFGTYYRVVDILRKWMTDLLDSVPNEVSEPAAKTRSLSLAFDSDASIDIGDPLPAGATVIGYVARIDTAFDGSAPTIEIGDAVASDAIIDTTVLDLTGAPDSGAADLIIPVSYAAATQLTAAYVADGSAAGAAEVTILYV
jgi:hypothetical protein